VGGTDRLAADAATDASCCGGGGGGGGGVDPVAGADPLAAAGAVAANRVQTPIASTASLISASKAAAISACDLTRPPTAVNASNWRTRSSSALTLRRFDASSEGELNSIGRRAERCWTQMHN
jgi:hypothetical protein